MTLPASGEGGEGGGIPGEDDFLNGILEQAKAWKGERRGSPTTLVTFPQAERLGELWVGSTRRVITGTMRGVQYRILQSIDGLRQYRPPTRKIENFQEVIGANLEWRNPRMASNDWNNFHLTIVPGP